MTRIQALAEGDWRKAFETWWAAAENEADEELCKLSALLGYRAALASKPQPNGTPMAAQEASSVSAIYSALYGRSIGVTTNDVTAGAHLGNGCGHLQIEFNTWEEANEASKALRDLEALSNAAAPTPAAQAQSPAPAHVPADHQSIATALREQGERERTYELQDAFNRAAQIVERMGK